MGKNARIIIVTGPKHSGKTSAGRALSLIAEGDFIDLDELVEERTGETPRMLYRKGAAVLWKAEAEALAQIFCSRGKTGKRLLVVAAGGGLIDNSAALALISERHEIITVYLDIKTGTAWNRIKAAADIPGGELPSFLDTANPEAAHRELHERRAEAYRNFSRITINGENKSPEEIAAEITMCLGGEKERHDQ